MEGHGGYPLVAAAKGGYIRRHVIVCEAYHGERPPGGVVRHRNGIAGDDRQDNLQWGSQADNCQDTIDHGRTTTGEKNSQHKITEEDVLEIRARAATGETQGAIGADYGLRQGSVSSIVNRQTWKHI